MYNKVINIDNVEYELLFSFDSDTDLYEKNKLQYFTKERDVVVFCEDYRFWFKNKHQIKDFGRVDEYVVYGKKND